MKAMLVRMPDKLAKQIHNAYIAFLNNNNDGETHVSKTEFIRFLLNLTTQEDFISKFKNPDLKNV